MKLKTQNKYWNDKRLANSIHCFVVFVIVAFGLTQTCCLNAAQAVPKQKGSDEEKPKPLSPEEISQIWKKIRISTPPSSVKSPVGSVGYWIYLKKVSFSELNKIIVSSNPRKGLEYYVNQFGKYGAQTDMRWLLAARSHLLPANRRIQPDQDKKIRRMQLIFTELQVRQFLKEPQLLARYYHSVIWFNNMFADINFPVFLGNVYRNMKESTKDDNYWWYAQNFVLMAHATGRDDLLKDVKPEDLKPRFQQWFEWFRKNGMYLRASPNSIYWVLDKGEKSRKEGYVPFVLKQTLPPLKVHPEYPFPDWKGPKPTMPQNYRSME